MKSINDENLVKIGQVNLEIICLKWFISSNEGVHADYPLKRRCYWTEVHQI